MEQRVHENVYAILDVVLRGFDHDLWQMRDIPINLSQSAVVVELIVSSYSAPFYVNSTSVYINRKRCVLILLELNCLGEIVLECASRASRMYIEAVPLFETIGFGSHHGVRGRLDNS